MAFGITAAALAGAYILLGYYPYALYALLAAVVCMEIRVRLGFRNPRKVLFWAHIAASVLLVGTLILIVRSSATSFLRILAIASYFVSVVAGGILLSRTHRAYLAQKAALETEEGA
jgi:hypothetical protein